MLADYIAMDMVGVYAEVVAEERPKAGGIERCTGANDPVRWNAVLGRVTGGQVRHYVNGIAYYQKHCFGGVVQYPVYDVLKNGGVPLEKLEAALARLLSNPGCNDDHAAPFELGIVSRLYLERMSEGRCMENIVRLGLSTLFIPIDQDHFPAHAPHYKGICGCCADKSGANDANFHYFSFYIKDETACSSGRLIVLDEKTTKYTKRPRREKPFTLFCTSRSLRVLRG
jgi:hypothetical protein